MARPRKKVTTVDDIQKTIEAINRRLEKMAIIQQGMRAEKKQSIKIDHHKALDKALDALAKFCEDALWEVRSGTDRSERQWDKCD